MMLAKDEFARQALPRLRQEHPEMKPSERMKVAMQTEWPVFKATLKLPEAAETNSTTGGCSQAASISVATPVVAELASKQSVSLADSSKFSVRVLGLQAATPTALPPPAFMPVQQRAKCQRRTSGPKLRPRQAAAER
eukprot:945662-Prymnesium_polylepis.1